MTEDQTVVAGHFAQELMSHPQYLLLVHEFKSELGQQMLNTIPPAHAEREEIYYTYNGFAAFESWLTAVAKAKNALLAKRDLEALSDTEDALDDIYTDYQ